MWLLALLACQRPSADDPCVRAPAWADSDGDGFGDLATAADVCPGTAGYVGNTDDCDDADASIHPGATEICNALDDDCDGESDAMLAWYADADGDAYGAGAKQLACTAPDGFVAEPGDCDDADAAIHPGAAEICNALDDDCDGADDEGFDLDEDGHWSSLACAKGDDCDDADPSVYEGAPELCGDGRDNDCVEGGECGFTGVYGLAYADAIVYATEEYEYMATQVETGDVDGDGTLDVLSASSQHLSGWAGGARVLYGPIFGTHEVGELGFMAYGTESSGSGRSIGIGDVNEDGYADIEIGAPYADGEAWVQFGPVTADVDLADASVHYDGGYYPLFAHGSDVADVDADGIEDVIVGSFDYGGEASAGMVLIDFGPVTAGEIDMLDQHDVELYGSELYVQAGRVIRAGEDMDGDGVGDVMLQGAGYSGGAPGGGAVIVAHGPFPSNLDLADADAWLIGGEPNIAAGVSFAQGDVDGDGNADALIGAPFARAGAGPREDPGGRAFVVAGATTGMFDLSDADTVIKGTNATYLGYQVAAGDLDGDGQSEVLVSGYSEDDAATATYVFYGAMPGMWEDGNAWARFVDTASDALAMTLATADLDANGRADMLFGAPDWRPDYPGGVLYIVMSY